MKGGALYEKQICRLKKWSAIKLVTLEISTSVCNSWTQTTQIKGRSAYYIIYSLEKLDSKAVWWQVTWWLCWDMGSCSMCDGWHSQEGAEQHPDPLWCQGLVFTGIQTSSVLVKQVFRSQGQRQMLCTVSVNCWGGASPSQASTTLHLWVMQK